MRVYALLSKGPLGDRREDVTDPAPDVLRFHLIDGEPPSSATGDGPSPIVEFVDVEYELAGYDDVPERHAIYIYKSTQRAA